MKLLPLFHFFFYGGSLIPQAEYTTLTQALQRHILKNDESLTFMPGLYNNIWNTVKRKENPFDAYQGNDTILIGHSLGGYFALRDARRHPDKVKAIVLINSHLNSRGKMMYTKTKATSINQPLLTILGERDDKLPISKALDDLYESIDENHYYQFYYVNPDTHLSGIKYPRRTIKQIKTFVNCVENQNFTEIRQDTEPLRKRFTTDVRQLSETISIVHSDTNGVIDGLLHWVSPRWIWNFYKWSVFVTSSPSPYYSHIYTDGRHIWIKGSTNDRDSVRKCLQHWSLGQPYKLVESTLPSIHPAILAWLLLPLFCQKKNAYQLNIPYTVFPVNKAITYYKVPHPHYIFAFTDFKMSS
jgi:predicted esterase